MSELKTIQATTHARFSPRLFGSPREDKMSGTAGSRKRGSWWGIRESRALPERALKRGSFGIERRGGKSRRSAGPRRRGRETAK